MLSKNRDSHLRATEIVTRVLWEILKSLVIGYIAGMIRKYGKVAYNWSKPSLINYKNRVELVFHQFALILGFESRLRF
jgi:hypothetical protein